MLSQYKTEEMFLFLTKVLDEYEVIPAKFGWHIHKENTYCGHLEYQETTGWQGSAFNHLPTTLREQLKRFTQSDSSVYKTMSSGNLLSVA
ncbi:hypothetical protein [Mastigocladopsis repens]|uniref:hypothetical protein n=1 Tax=Mastigocladopsis repens TaxID=221287 RepID=UPI0002EFF948|nr:hypothetical protein [Mastigocladopsis repens]